MKKEHSIHRGMLTRFLFAALIPVLIFAMVMQWNNRKTQMRKTRFREVLEIQIAVWI